ncbi:MAG: MBL fold metallo-hydrolase [Alphaproteobacteria bacterium]|nr:MBL fold metallo-hydrolase [Alphaproteobacteria bacterium]
MLKPDVRGFFDPVTATWSYVVWSEGAADKKCAVIDSVLDYDMASGRTATGSADKLVAFVKQKGLQAEWILETHIHADHLTASRYLKEKLGGKTAISRHILEVLKTWQSVFHNEKDTPLDGQQFDYLFKDDETFSVGALEARIIHTPGHTPADTTYIIGDAVFVGDAMFLPDVGTGRCDFPGGSAADSYASTRKLLALPDDYRMYVGHDYPQKSNRGPLCLATIAEQKSANILANQGVGRDIFIKNRIEADKDKDVPLLLLPSLQVNLRAGSFGSSVEGVQYIKIPVDKI